MEARISVLTAEEEINNNFEKLTAVGSHTNCSYIGTFS